MLLAVHPAGLMYSFRPRLRDCRGNYYIMDTCYLSLTENAALELQERRASRLDQCPHEIDRNHIVMQMQVSQ